MIRTYFINTVNVSPWRATDLRKAHQNHWQLKKHRFKTDADACVSINYSCTLVVLTVAKAGNWDPTSSKIFGKSAADLRKIQTHIPKLDGFWYLCLTHNKLKQRALNPKSKIWKCKNPIETMTKPIQIRSPKSKIRNPNSKTQQPKSETQEPKSQIQHPKTKYWTQVLNYCPALPWKAWFIDILTIIRSNVETSKNHKLRLEPRHQKLACVRMIQRWSQIARQQKPGKHRWSCFRRRCHSSSRWELMAWCSFQGRGPTSQQPNSKGKHWRNLEGTYYRSVFSWSCENPWRSTKTPFFGRGACQQKNQQLESSPNQLLASSPTHWRLKGRGIQRPELRNQHQQEASQNWATQSPSPFSASGFQSALQSPPETFPTKRAERPVCPAATKEQSREVVLAQIEDVALEVSVGWHPTSCRPSLRSQWCCLSDLPWQGPNKSLRGHALPTFVRRLLSQTLSTSWVVAGHSLLQDLWMNLVFLCLLNKTLLKSKQIIM